MNGDVFVISLDPDGVWAYSKFPHPLITADYDADDKLIQLALVGPEAERANEALRVALPEVDLG